MDQTELKYEKRLVCMVDSEVLRLAKSKAALQEMYIKDVVEMLLRKYIRGEVKLTND